MFECKIAEEGELTLYVVVPDLPGYCHKLTGDKDPKYMKIFKDSI